ncbi:hypothetical protein DTI44_18960 [Salmonella enterica subsp. enterica serovar Enteritidis]|uniref:Uncharacterized protein n=1 Tax=Salmonella enteritidis TaxID=149539 RepID=A0A403FKA9_SALEN|nr:hypothetical protein [Salmonella enterica subsp. diarizonae]MJY20406.1 hypothetical protein [Salmonella enterica subsp. enterica serovar Enteritidis]
MGNNAELITGIEKKGLHAGQCGSNKKKSSGYTRHTSSCRCVGCVHSPESLTTVSSSGFIHLPPSCNPNYLG